MPPVFACVRNHKGTVTFTFTPHTMVGTTQVWLCGGVSVKSSWFET